GPSRWPRAVDGAPAGTGGYRPVAPPGPVLPVRGPGGGADDPQRRSEPAGRDPPDGPRPARSRAHCAVHVRGGWSHVRGLAGDPAGGGDVDAGYPAIGGATPPVTSRASDTWSDGRDRAAATSSPRPAIRLAPRLRPCCHGIGESDGSQRGPVDLAMPVEREPVEPHEQGRHHVVR